MKPSSRDRWDAHYINAEIADSRVVSSNPSRTIWLFSDKIIQMRRIGVGICKIYSVWHQTIELIKNHRFYVINA
jgi:hypothetical protein